MVNSAFHQNLVSSLGPMRSFALNLTRNAEDANDLIQETALRALRHKDKFSPGSNLKAWLATIMRNTFINKLRAAKRRAVLSDGSSNTYLIDSDIRQFVRNDGESYIMQEELVTIVDQLDKKFKEPFLLHYNGYSYEEIATQLQMPIGTIKSRIYTARQYLRKEVTRLYKADNYRELVAN
ncbi:MAG: RNA polymerase sigma factor [Bacteroidota bacterium]